MNNKNKYKYSTILGNKDGTQYNYNTNYINIDEVSDNRQGFKTFMTKTYALLALSLIITAACAYFVLPYTFYFLVSVRSSMPIIIISLIQVGIVIYLSYKLRKNIRLSTAIILLFLYDVITGIMLSSFLLLYNSSILLHAFAITTLFFVALCIVGHLTNYKILKWGRMLIFTLVFFLIFQVISLIFFPGFLSNPIVDLIGIGIFSFYTVYDYQSMKLAYNISDKSKENLLIVGSALQLYLNFINLFIYILRLVGSKTES